jgi:hypothetical protein
VDSNSFDAEVIPRKTIGILSPTITRSESDQ